MCSPSASKRWWGRTCPSHVPVFCVARVTVLPKCAGPSLFLTLPPETSVINELDGLAKGSREDHYADPNQSFKVREGAELSIRCLEEKFEQRNKYLRALTSKGTVMDTIAYRSEEVDFKVG